MLKGKSEGTPALSCPIEDMAQAMGTLGITAFNKSPV